VRSTLSRASHRFYDAGYTDGFAHGRIHGRIEGRALGLAKGFEMWEELGFYQGFAAVCNAALASSSSSSSSLTPTSTRAVHHVHHLLHLIGQFPRANPSTIDPALDIPRLFRQIRSRYKALCSILALKPPLRAEQHDTVQLPTS
jgi:hypothetical protein